MKVEKNYFTYNYIIRNIIILLSFFIILIVLTSCSIEKKENTYKILNKDGYNIENRYNPPEGYSRVEADKDSFAYFLRHEKLKKYGEKSIYYNGKEKKSEGVYDSVFDIDLEGKNLLHCADACYKFMGDYLYSQGKYDNIKFHFVSGGVADFGKYVKGYRVNPETGDYYEGASPSSSEDVYKKFINLVYAYSGTLSLEIDTYAVDIDDMQIGDVFVIGGTPGSKRVGHAIMVVDMAKDENNNKVFMLAQSYMPAQQTQILINKKEKEISPWYSLEKVKKENKLLSPQWTFQLNELRRFKIEN